MIRVVITVLKSSKSSRSKVIDVALIRLMATILPLYSPTSAKICSVAPLLLLLLVVLEAILDTETEWILFMLFILAPIYEYREYLLNSTLILANIIIKEPEAYTELMFFLAMRMKREKWALYSIITHLTLQSHF